MSFESQESNERNTPEYRDSTVTNCTCAYSVVPERVLSWKVQALSTGTSGQDYCVSRLERIRSAFLSFTPVFEWPFGKVEFRDGLSDDGCTKADGLLTKFIHELCPKDSFGEAWEVLNYQRVLSNYVTALGSLPAYRRLSSLAVLRRQIHWQGIPVGYLLLARVIIVACQCLLRREQD